MLLDLVTHCSGQSIPHGEIQLLFLSCGLSPFLRTIYAFLISPLNGKGHKTLQMLMVTYFHYYYDELITGNS